MAEEVNNTENTENGNVQQDTNTGAANTEPEKKYSEEDAAGFVNGVLGAVIEQ